MANDEAEDTDEITLEHIANDVSEILGLLDILYNELRPAHDHRRAILDKLHVVEELQLTILKQLTLRARGT